MNDARTVCRKAAALGAIGMALLLGPNSQLQFLGWIIAFILTVAAIPAYLGLRWGVTILRILYWLLLIGWGSICFLYYVVGPMGGTVRSPGFFFVIVLVWCIGGIRALTSLTPSPGSSPKPE